MASGGEVGKLNTGGGMRRNFFLLLFFHLDKV